MAYLDHAGATLYSEAQMADVVKDLTSNVYGNPRILKLELAFSRDLVVLIDIHVSNSWGCVL